MVDALATPQARQDVVLFLLPIGGDQKSNGLSNDLSRGVAEEPFRRAVPRDDRPVEGLADDRVVARVDDRGQVPRVALEPLALRQVGHDGRLHPCIVAHSWLEILSRVQTLRADA